MPHSSSPQFHTTTFNHIVIFHILHYATFHIPGHHIISTPRHIPHHTFCISIMSEMAKFTSHHITHTLTSDFISNHSTASHPGTSCPHSTPCTFKYKFHITLSHSTTHPTLHLNHHFTSPPCLIWHRQTIPHQSLGIPQPHFTSSQHTTIFHMYHTIVPHRNTTFLI